MFHSEPASALSLLTVWSLWELGTIVIGACPSFLVWNYCDTVIGFSSVTNKQTNKNSTAEFILIMSIKNTLTRHCATEAAMANLYAEY